MQSGSGYSRSTLWRHAQSELKCALSMDTNDDAGFAENEDSYDNLMNVIVDPVPNFQVGFDINADECDDDGGLPVPDETEGPGRLKTFESIMSTDAFVETSDFASDLILDSHWQHELSSESDCESGPDEPIFDPETDLKVNLAEWCCDYNISHAAVGALLEILRKLHPSLPRDPRTLLGTPSECVVKSIGGGEYSHLGVEKGLSNLLSCISTPVTLLELQISTDGLPLFKSSGVYLWPILCSVTNIDKRDPFVVGLFCGKEKPNNAAEFLLDFVTEMSHLLKHGLKVSGKHYSVNIHTFVCDAPARAFIKGVKLHSGYSSCEKCTVHGDYAGNKVVFRGVDAPLRTDYTFRTRLDDEHHNVPCPLDPLPIGMVSRFGLDYMHLACLGVMRRILFLWKGPPGPLHVRLDRKSISKLSSRLEFISPHVPVEFTRKPRSVDEAARWKATEFRSLMLYYGPCVFNGIISANVYDHYMLLFVALRILASPQFAVMYNDYADKLLLKFVKDTELIYGEELMLYNIHNLIHLAADVRELGCLDEFSAFIFENKLGQLKKLVRKPERPLQQIIRRLEEQQRWRSTVTAVSTEFPTVKIEHHSGPMLPALQGATQYRQLKTKEWSLHVDVGNNCFMTRGGVPALVKNIVIKGDNVHLICAKFEIVTDAFTSPLPSSKLNICHVEKESKHLFELSVADVACKCVCLPLFCNRPSFVIIPLLHSNL